MSNENNHLLEAVLPTAEYAISLVSLFDPTFAVTASTFILPFRYYLASCSEIEKQEVKQLFIDLASRLNKLEKDCSNLTFLSSQEGQHLLLRAVKTSTNLRGTEKRRIAIDLLLGHNKNTDSSGYSTEDFLNLISTLTNYEISLLMTVWKLYPSKDKIDTEREDSITSPSFKVWPELYKELPQHTSIELVAIFNRLQSSGLVIREQGFFDDDGSTFGFTPLFSKLMAAVQSSPY